MNEVPQKPYSLLHSFSNGQGVPVHPSCAFVSFAGVVTSKAVEPPVSSLWPSILSVVTSFANLSLHCVNAKQNMPSGQSSVFELGHRIEHDSFTSSQLLPQKKVFSGYDKLVKSIGSFDGRCVGADVESRVGKEVGNGVGSFNGCCVGNDSEVGNGVGDIVGSCVGGLLLIVAGFGFPPTVGNFPPTGFLPPVGLGPSEIEVLFPVGILVGKGVGGDNGESSPASAS